MTGLGVVGHAEDVAANAERLPLDRYHRLLRDVAHRLPPRADPGSEEKHLRLSGGGDRPGPLRRLVEERRAEHLEGRLHVLPRLLRGQTGAPPPRRGELPHVGRRLRLGRGEVDLVHRQLDGDSADDVPDGADPFPEVLIGLRPREVRHGHDPMRAEEVGLLEHLPGPALPHDVPDGEDQSVRPLAVRGGERHGLRVHPRPQGPEVPLVERVLHVPEDEAGLPDGGGADQADLLPVGVHAADRGGSGENTSGLAIANEKTAPRPPRGEELSPEITDAWPSCGHGVLGPSRMSLPMTSEPPSPKVSKTYLKATLTRLRNDPEDLDALFTFGTWLAMTERYDEAVEVLHEITKRDPNYPGVWVLKSQVYRRMGKERMADLCMERDLAINSV